MSSSSASSISDIVLPLANVTLTSPGESTPASATPSQLSSPSRAHITPPSLPKQTTPYRLSPHNLRCTGCSCTTPRQNPTTSEELQKLLYDRFDKVWTRAMHMTAPSKVAHALARVCLELRHKAGIEFVHLAAREYGRNVTRGFRREVSVLLLVPDPDMSEEGNGHICMAEMLVHLDASTNELENVASRFWYDWEDWTVPQYLDYVKDFKAEPLKVRIPDKRANVPWSTVMDSLLEAVQKVTRCIVDRASFKALVKRVSEELKVSDLQERVYEWQVEKVWSKGLHRRAFPVIRIAFKVMQGRSYKEDPGAVMLMELEVESKKTFGGEESNDKPMRKVNNMSVVYDGEWPIFHHYRTDIPPPSLEDLGATEKR